MALAAQAVLAGCFSPEVERCAVQCGADPGAECPPGSVCLGDGMCHAAGDDRLCSIIPTGDAGPDGGSEVLDGGLSDAGPPVTPSEPGQIVISELMINPDAFDEESREWFEVYNPSQETTYDLKGLEVRGELVTEEFAIDRAVVIGPQQRALFARSGDPEQNGGLEPDFVYGNDLPLGNSSGEVTIIYPLGDVVIDQVAYGSAWPRSEGRSTSLDPDQHDAVANDNVASWCSGMDPYTPEPPHEYGTPGEPNPQCP